MIDSRLGADAIVLRTEHSGDPVARLKAENEALRASLADLRAQLSEIERLADTDTLVPLPNRRAFERELARVIAGVSRYRHSAALLFLDLNSLKTVNDRHGHQAGDAVLLHVASCLKASLRAADMVARIGGDEFAMILDHLDEADARAKVDALVAAISDGQLKIGAATVTVSVTAGLAMVMPDDTIDSVLGRADAAMYAQRSAR